VEKEFKCGAVVISTKDSFLMIRDRATGKCTGLTGLTIKACGMMGLKMEKAN
jgi:hypothetical protein